MKLPAAIERSIAKFDAMSLRERVLVAAALAAALAMVWTIAIHDRIEGRRRALLAEITSIQDALLSPSFSMTAASDPVALALAREQELAIRLEEIDAKLGAHSAGLIPPERMVEVIHDVLSRQRGVKLVSLHNKPVSRLAQSTAEHAARNRSDGNDAQESPDEQSGPYMHPVEIVIEGRYLDILAYLRALEKLEWRFYWKRLELTTVDYPSNRVRIELGTLSMEKEWIGV